MISSFHIKRKRDCRDSYFSEVVREYPLRMQRTIQCVCCDRISCSAWNRTVSDEGLESEKYILVIDMYV